MSVLHSGVKMEKEPGGNREIEEEEFGRKAEVVLTLENMQKIGGEGNRTEQPQETRNHVTLA